MESRDDILRGSSSSGGLPIDEPEYTWPTEFSGDCYGLDRN